MSKNNHGGFREGSGAKYKEGTTHEITLSQQEKDDLKNCYSQLKTVPKRVLEAVSDVVRYKTEVMDITNVSMEIFNGEGGRIQFYVSSEENSAENNLMEVERTIPCRKIRYYKRSNLFEITALMGIYVNGGTTAEAVNIENTRINLEKIKECLSTGELLLLYKNPKFKENIKVRLELGQEVNRISRNFGLKYDTKALEFNSKFWNFESYIMRINHDYDVKTWLDNNFDIFFKEKLRERISQEQQDSYIKYDELMEVIKEDIAAKNIEYHIPETYLNGDKIKKLEANIDYGTNKLEILERRKSELDELDNSEVNSEYVKKNIENEMEKITDKIISYKRELNDSRKKLDERRKRNLKLKELGVERNLIKFEWDKFLNSNEIKFIKKFGEELEEKTNVLNTLKRISKILEKDILKSSTPKISSDIIAKYMSMALNYLEKLYELRNEDIDKDSLCTALEGQFSRLNFNIDFPCFKKWDKNLDLQLDFYSLFSDTSIKEVVELQHFHTQLKKYCTEKIDPIINKFNEEINKKREDREYCDRLIEEIKERIFNYHKSYSLNTEIDCFDEWKFKFPYDALGKDKKDKGHIRQIARYVDKLKKINQHILGQYEDLKDERDEELKKLLNEAEKVLVSFDELKDEVELIEVKPNNYIVSN